jgi:hypothetical protein
MASKAPANPAGVTARRVVSLEFIGKSTVALKLLLPAAPGGAGGGGAENTPRTVPSEILFASTTE